MDWVGIVNRKEIIFFQVELAFVYKDNTGWKNRGRPIQLWQLITILLPNGPNNAKF